MSFRPMTGVEWALLVTLALVWGGSFLFAKVGVAEIPPLTLVLLRVALAAAALNLVMRAAGTVFPTDRRLLLAFMVMGALNNVIPFSLIFWGQQTIASGLASILNATTPLWTVLLSHAFVAGERLTITRLAGVLLGLVGVAVLIGPEALSGLGSALLAQLACLAGAVSYAFSGIYGRRFRALPPIVPAAGQLTASTLMMAPVALLVDRPWLLAMPSAEAIASLVALALLCTAFAYLLFFRILATAGSTNVLLVTFLVPVSAILLGAVFLGERLAAVAFIGMGLIGLGLAAIDGRPMRWFYRRDKGDRKVTPSGTQLEQESSS